MCLHGCNWDAGCSCNLPNHACWSPWTSIAKPKSASLTAAPFTLLASSKFSGCKRDIKISQNQKRIQQNQCFFIASRWSSKLWIYCCCWDISFSQERRIQAFIDITSIHWSLQHTLFSLICIEHKFLHILLLHIKMVHKVRGWMKKETWQNLKAIFYKKFCIDP